MATWGSMLKAPGNIVSGVGSGIMKAVKYTIYGAVVCGIAVAVNQFASNAFGIENYAATAVDYIGSVFGWAVEGIVNSVGNIFRTASPGATLQPLITPGTIDKFIGGTATTISAEGALGSQGAIGTVQGWANGIGSTIGNFFTARETLDLSRATAGGHTTQAAIDAATATVETNNTIANAALGVGGAAAAVGTTVGKWQAAEDQRRASRAQALQQLG